MIRTLASISILIACQTAVSAQGRPDMLLVLGTGPNLYDRYVASRAFCRDEQLQPLWLATAAAQDVSWTRSITHCCASV